MLATKYSDVLGPALTQALVDKGYEQLTAVQEAVLDPALAGRDLRITSQTGSGKTLAIGFALRELMAEDTKAVRGVARPRAIVVAPTRELALQVESELKWLYAKSKGRITSVTGGASYRDEQRALGAGPTVVVGTPGRALDHLRRGGIDASVLRTVVLDEADRMLDLGFREELEAILEFATKERRTHLVSATFPRAVRALADSVQTNPAHVEGTRLGAANADIDHVMYVVDGRQKVDAIVNLLLRYPDDQTLIFARTRIEVGEIAAELVRAGFAAASLSGEMDQAARNRALATFKRGALSVLVATEVAARGIDVQDISRVIHAEVPSNPDAYTHRAGRTGRAGRKGTSALLVPPAGVVHATRLLRTCNVAHRFEPIPTPEEIRSAADERVVAELTAESPEASVPESKEAANQAVNEARMLALAERLLEAGNPARTIARLLARTRYASTTEARAVRVLHAPQGRGRGDDRDRGPRRDSRNDDRREPRWEPRQDARREPARTPDRERASAPDRPRASTPDRESSADAPRRERAPQAEARNGEAASGETGYTSFRVSWGAEHGADARRLLAAMCRRGDIRGKDVGAIRIDRSFSIVDVNNSVAEAFEAEAGKPDPRDPRVLIRRDFRGANGTSAAPARSEAPARGGFAKRGPKAPFKKARKPAVR